MATGVSARVAIVCAVLWTVAGGAIAQVPLDLPTDRPVTATPPNAAPVPQPTIARGGTRRRVAVIDLADGAAEDLTSQLYGVLQNHIDLLPLADITIEKALKGRFIDEERRFIDAAKAAKAEAETALVNQEYPLAEARAAAGMRELHNVRPSPDVLGLYAELAFDAGQAVLRLRKPNDASMLFGLTRRLDSTKQPDPSRYEPDIVEAFGLAVTKIAVPARLEVKGTGTVWIDGIDRGPPGTFDVSEGVHLVQLTGPERETRGTQVNVPVVPGVEIESAPVTLEVKVQRLRVELANTRDAAARAGALKKLATLLGIGDAVLIEKTESGLRVQTWRDRDGFSKLVEPKPGSPGELLHPLAPPRVVEEPGPKEEVPVIPVVPEIQWYRKRWVQVVGVVGVVVAGAVIYGLASQEGMILWDRDPKFEDQ
jgi:hypothetical protein